MASSKVLAAISGGVDSSVTAALLLEQGYDCTGLFMITHDRAQQAQQDAQEVCRHLGITLQVVDFRKEFEQIIAYFVDEYKSGRTPNPCVYCNRFIKFGKLWDIAGQLGCGFIATGHYAQIRTVNDTFSCRCRICPKTKHAGWPDNWDCRLKKKKTRRKSALFPTTITRRCLNSGVRAFHRKEKSSIHRAVSSASMKASATIPSASGEVCV